MLRDLEKDFDPTTPSKIAEAIEWAVDNGAEVINLSLTTDPTPALERAIDYALDEGVVVVAAAGNDGGSDGNEQTAYPAAYDGGDRRGRHRPGRTSRQHVDLGRRTWMSPRRVPRSTGLCREVTGTRGSPRVGRASRPLTCQGSRR